LREESQLLALSRNPAGLPPHRPFLFAWSAKTVAAPRKDMQRMGSGAQQFFLRLSITLLPGGLSVTKGGFDVASG
jgi:hypothetical protein